jgi:hypothetical protein
MAKKKKTTDTRRAFHKSTTNEVSFRVWKVECSIDGLLDAYPTRQQALDARDEHIQETGHPTKVIGRQ